MDPAFSLALGTGLLGGFGHCMGMCGPIVASEAVSRGAKAEGWGAGFLGSLQYHAGRLFTYSAIGALMGLSGSFANTAGALAGIQDLAAPLSGLAMIAMGAGILGLWRGTALIERNNSLILRQAGRILAGTAALRSLVFGAAMGLLPCGLSYTVFMAAAGTGAAFPGMLVALLFGLGTLPALLLFGTLASRLGATRRLMITRASGIVVMLTGVYYLARGLGFHAPL
ncbi:MAG: sulfite exporter TauE/SafE family protein [Rectinemataceae bacterium]